MLEERPEAQTRVGRSNSLQRMLDLEKHFMIQRLQALPPNGTSPTATTTSRSRPPLSHSNPNSRRPASALPNTRSPRHDSSFAPQKSPVVLTQFDHTRQPYGKPSMTSSITAAEQYVSLVDEIRIQTPDELSMQPDKPSPKVVAFQFPPEFSDRNSLCQSPSWEAYDRRKKEKKDEKKEEKRREEEERRGRKREEERRKEAREAEKRESSGGSRRPRRLSKPPPVPAQSPGGQVKLASASTPNMRPAPRTQKPRPASVLGLTFPFGHDHGSDYDTDTVDERRRAQASRKRSGSLTALIRAPFESRRASIDHPGGYDVRGDFIGGIKLEQERFDAQQLADETNIHPALRKSQTSSSSSQEQPGSLSSSSPLASPRARPSTDSASGQRRAYYPPIAILTTSSKTRSLAAPELGRMDRLKARVGLNKKTPSPQQQPDRFESSLATRPGTAAGSNVSLPQYESDAEKKPVTRGEPFSSPSMAPEPLRLRTDKTGGSKGRRNMNEKALDIKIPPKEYARSPVVSAKSSPRTPVKQISHGHQHETAARPQGEPTLSDLMAQDQGRRGNEDMLLPPLQPPRKSSKRSLGTSSTGSSPKTTTPRYQVEPSSPSVAHRPAAAEEETPQNFHFGMFDGVYNPPSLELSMPEDSHRSTKASSPRRVDQGSFSPAKLEAPTNSLGITTGLAKVPPRSSPAELPGGQSAQQPNHTHAANQEKPTIRRKPIDSSAARDPLRLVVPGRPQSFSAEESSADELPLSTPGTSRPQSEKDLVHGALRPPSEKDHPPTPTDLGSAAGESGERRKTAHHQRHKATTQEELAGTALPAPPPPGRFHQRRPSMHSDIDEDIELERIQAAARKVMAAFPGSSSSSNTHLPPVPPLPPSPTVLSSAPSSPRKSFADLRAQSDTEVSSASGGGFLPRLKLRKDKKSKSKLGQVAAASTSQVELCKEKGAAAAAALREQLLNASAKAKSAGNLSLRAREQRDHQPPLPPLPPLSAKSLPDTSSSRFLAPQASRPSTSSSSQSPAATAKMFVECCGCRYYHDMPSRLYETMVSASASANMSAPDASKFRGAAPMTVRCPWCAHDMSTRCCAGLAAMVFVKERLH